MTICPYIYKGFGRWETAPNVVLVPIIIQKTPGSKWEDKARDKGLASAYIGRARSRELPHLDGVVKGTGDKVAAVGGDGD